MSMTRSDNDSLTSFAIELAAASAVETLQRFRSPMEVEVKVATDWDPVTEADRAAERAMRRMIESRFPDHGILGEEYGTKDSESDFTWILDPIDGTRAFVIGMPTWATLIGLYYKGKPFLGVMSQPYVGDTFVGNPGGAWKIRGYNRTPLQVGKTTSLRDARIGTTTPHRYFERDAENFDQLRKTATLMRYGGDAYFFSLLAEGCLDIAMDPGLQVYDIAALIPIISGAGGIVATWDGAEPSQGGNVIAAATDHLMTEALKVMTANR
jgi:myo-inositol-1(or 4)-monophosphatase